MEKLRMNSRPWVERRLIGIAYNPTGSVSKETEEILRKKHITDATQTIRLKDDVLCHAS